MSVSLPIPLPPAAAGVVLPGGDLQAVADWLREVEVTRAAATWRSYRKEAERLLLWLGQQGLTLARATRPDLAAYQALLQRPPQAWLAGRNLPRTHPDWRPLVRPLSPASVAQALVILHNLFDWLLQQGRAGVTRNPLHKWRMPARQPGSPRARTLSRSGLARLRATVEALPRTTLRDYHHYFRARWLLALLLIGGLRREEIVTARMGDFRHHADADVWTLRVIGKGDKAREVTVTAEWLAELRYYRAQALGRADLPRPDEATPLLFRLNGKGWRAPQPLGGPHLYQLVKTLLRRAADEAEAQGAAHLAAELRAASPHWFRHAAITAKLEAGVPIEDVAEEAGHADLKTTQRYTHKSVAERARRLQTLTLLQPPAAAAVTPPQRTQDE